MSDRSGGERDAGTAVPAPRRLAADELDALAAALADAAPTNPKGDPDLLRWQYLENPSGPARAWVVEDEVGIASHLALLPHRAVLHGRPVTVGVTADLATHPRARGRGLATAVTRAAVADAAASGYAAVLSKPNDQALGPLRRLGFEPAQRLRMWALPLTGDWLAGQLGLRPGWLRPVARAARAALERAPDEAEPLDPSDPDLDHLWRVTARQSGFHGLVHDQRYWAWRHARPGASPLLVGVRRHGHLVAAAGGVVRERWGAPVLHVLDLQATNVAGARAALAGLVDRARHAEVVAHLGTRHSRTARLAAAAGLQPLPSRYLASRRSIGILPPLGGAGDELAAVPWSIAWCDLDHV